MQALKKISLLFIFSLLIINTAFADTCPQYSGQTSGWANIGGTTPKINEQGFFVFTLAQWKAINNGTMYCEYEAPAGTPSQYITYYKSNIAPPTAADGPWDTNDKTPICQTQPNQVGLTQCKFNLRS